MNTVRVRITLVATVVLAAAMFTAGWLLVRSVEDTQLGRLRDATEARLDDVVALLEDGVPATQAVLDAEPVGLVEVLHADGRVLAVSPAVPGAGGVVIVTGGGQGTGSSAFSDQAPFPGDPGERRVELVDEFSARLDILERTASTPEGDVVVRAAAPVDEVQASVDAVRRALWLGLPVLVALVGGLAWLFVGQALRPVEAMRSQAESITATTMHRRVPEPGTDDEIGRLARTLNAMLDRLEGSATRQRQFVSDASHELRSPVAAIRTDLEVAQREGDDADWPAVAAAVLAEEARLEALLADLLVLAAADEWAPAGQALVDLAATVGDEAGRARRVPVAVAADEPAVVAGSSTSLRRVVANLIDNAARHAESAVAVGISTDDGMVRLTVDDDGAGIPLVERDRVFERFTRLDDGRARDQGGAGLGLAVVRSIVSQHSGRVWIEGAPPPLAGARVIVELPARGG